MMIVAATLALFAAAAPQTAEAPKPGKYLTQADGRQIARIQRVLADGSVVVIVGEKYVTVPAATVSVKDGKASTTMTQREIARM
jgi:hypothetical protein